jgi:hypothetical protein
MVGLAMMQTYQYVFNCYLGDVAAQNGKGRNPYRQ